MVKEERLEIDQKYVLGVQNISPDIKSRLACKVFCNSKIISKLFNDECWKLVLAESVHEIVMEKAGEDVWALFKAAWTYIDMQEYSLRSMIHSNIT